MPLILALAPAILQGIMMLLKWFGDKTVNDEKKLDFYNSLKEMARVLNLPDLVKKFELAEEQLKKNKLKWNEIEKEENKK